MLLDGEPQESGEIHEMQTPDRMAPRGESKTGKGALEAKNEALACCTVEDGMEQELGLNGPRMSRAIAKVVSTLATLA